MKVKIRLRGRTDTEVAEMITNFLGLLVIVLIGTLFLLAAGLDIGQ